MNRQFLMKTKFSDALLKIIFFSFFSFFNFLSLQAQNNFDVGAKSSLRKLQLAEMAISRLYVDTVNEESLVENGIRGMLEKLDPHSSYTTARETKAMNESLNGSFEGIGCNLICRRIPLSSYRPSQMALQRRWVYKQATAL